MQLLLDQLYYKLKTLRYSRLFEKEADRVGFANLVRAGYNPKSMGEMFENMNRFEKTFWRSST